MRHIALLVITIGCLLFWCCSKEEEGPAPESNPQSRAQATLFVGKYHARGYAATGPWIGGGADTFHVAGIVNASNLGNARLKIDFIDDDDPNKQESLTADIDEKGCLHFSPFTIQGCTITTNKSAIALISPDSVGGIADCTLEKSFKLASIHRTCQLHISAKRIP